MKITELITDLQKHLTTYGDDEVVHSSSKDGILIAESICSVGIGDVPDVTGEGDIQHKKFVTLASKASE